MDKLINKCIDLINKDNKGEPILCNCGAIMGY